MSMARLDRIRSIMRDAGADALLLSRLTDIRWAVGFTGSNALLVVDFDHVHLITDGRYTTQAANEVTDARVHIAPGPLYTTIGDSELLRSAERVVFQSDDLTFEHVEILRTVLSDFEWDGRAGLLTREIAAKTEAEVESIRRAQSITERTFERVLDLIRPGVTEREIAAEIVYDQIRRGAERMSFDPIVGSGPNGALPHARPSARALQNGDLIVLDFGCVVDGYASDMTRTVALGVPPDDALEAYDVVLRAQQAAIDAARAGMRADVLDAAARDVIRTAGLGAYFNHSLGHGIGLETHEWPRISHNSDAVLPGRCVVTIEPGVYIPGRFGIRIEDIVVLQDGPAENLTTAPKHLIRV